MDQEKQCQHIIRRGIAASTRCSNEGLPEWNLCPSHLKLVQTPLELDTDDKAISAIMFNIYDKVFIYNKQSKILIEVMDTHTSKTQAYTDQDLLRFNAIPKRIL